MLFARQSAGPERILFELLIESGNHLLMLLFKKEGLLRVVAFGVDHSRVPAVEASHLVAVVLWSDDRLFSLQRRTRLSGG